MTVYGYTRASTTEQTEGTSLADQTRRITGAALIRSDEPATIVADEGVSGSTPLTARPAGGPLWASLVVATCSSRPSSIDSSGPLRTPS
jgi:putative DNA-invertase from lambdoid prophage Rac